MKGWQKTSHLELLTRMKSLPTTIAARRRPSYGRVRSGTRPPPPPRSTGRARAAPQYSQSKVRASGSAAAAREAALSAEVVELNRTVGRMSRRRLADLSYEARLRKQQRESRGPARAEAGCSPLRFDENAWSNGDWAPAAPAQPCRTMHGYPTYEEAMEEYVTQMSAAERTELEYYRSLTYVSY